MAHNCSIACCHAAGAKGEVHHVDSGYPIVGVKPPDAADIPLSKE